METTKPIWKLPRIEDLLDAPEPAVQQWAASTLFRLYPQEAERRLPDLLQDSGPLIVQETLRYIARKPRPQLIPLLREVFLEGGENESALAMRVLGSWKAAEVLSIVKERTLGPASLRKEQVLAMIYALGRLPDEEAYRFLKLTENAIQERDSRFWEFYYAALLQHEKPEEIETLLTAAMDETMEEERRRDALGLLLARTDPQLNPSNVFFSHESAIRDYWRKRLDDPDMKQQIRGSSIEGSMERIASMKVEEIFESLEILEIMVEASGGRDDFEARISRRSLELLRKNPGTTPWHYGLFCLIVSGVFSSLERRAHPHPGGEADWKTKARHLLRNVPTTDGDEALRQEVIRGAPPSELIPLLTESIETHPSSWSALKAVEMLGEMKAVEAVSTVVDALKKAHDRPFMDVVAGALLHMEISVTPDLIPFLDGRGAEEKFLALAVLSQLPTLEGLQAILARLPALYAQDSERTLEAIRHMAAEAFLPFVDAEYREGEWALGRAYIFICRLNGLRPPRLREIERDVKRGDAVLDEERRIMAGDQAALPTSIQMELLCNRCGKKYQYEIHQLHLHPKQKEGEGEERSDRSEGPEMPYQQDVVIVDDLRCKNCSALNEFLLTDRSLSQITLHSVKLFALQKMGSPVPGHYPIQHVSLKDRDGVPMNILDVEREHLEAVSLYPLKPGVHLAVGKFYEYVKRSPEARRAYLKALDLDSLALEAMAGLARLDHAAGKLKEAHDWMEDCYGSLDKGRIYLAEDEAAFKKTVREKRKEFARDLGVKTQDKAVAIRFSVEVPEYPKNKPCHCGSGKKYKLCCMKKSE